MPATLNLPETYTPVDEPLPRKRPVDPSVPPTASEPISAQDFNPPEKVTSLILSDLFDPEAPLPTIARRASTTLEALTLWLARPDIAARVAALEAGLALKTRITIEGYTSGVLSAMGRIIHAFNYHESRLDATSNRPQEVALACRNRNTAIDAGKVFLGLKASVTKPARSRRAAQTPPSDSGRNLNLAHNPNLPASDSADLLSLRSHRFPAHEAPTNPEPHKLNGKAHTYGQAHAHQPPTSPASGALNQHSRAPSTTETSSPQSETPPPSASATPARPAPPQTCASKSCSPSCSCRAPPT